MAALAWPIVGTQVGVVLMMTTDVVMLGWLSPEALAAGSLGSGIYYTLWIFCSGLAMAGAPMMAQAVGRKLHQVRDIRRTLRQSWWTVLAAGVPCILALSLMEPLLHAIDQPAATVRAASAYVGALSVGFLPSLFYMCLRNFVSALERPRSAFMVTLAAVLLNGVTAYAFIFGALGMPRMGVVGAGIATAVCSTFSLVALLGFVLWDRRFRRYHVLGRWWRADWPRFRELMRIGTPIGVAMLFEVALFAGSSLLMGWLGTAEMAASYIAMQIASATFMVPMGIGQACCVRVGIFAGAGDAKGVLRAGWAALLLGVGFMMCSGVVMWTVPEKVVGFYLGDVNGADRALVLALGTSYLTIAALFQVFDAIQVIGAGALRGLKDTRVPMIYAGIGYWAIGMPACVLLAFVAGWRGQGVWYGFVMSLVVMAMLMVSRFFRLAHRLP